MDTSLLQAKAHRLRELHKAPPILLLANVWDVASARIVEEAGYPAIATTSAGIANMLGYPDGQHISRDEMLSIVGRIARAVSVPVTADMEAGYSTTPEGAAECAKAVLDAGAVGMNFEDSTGDASAPLFDLSTQVARIKAIRAACDSTGVPFVLNARTDVYLEQVGEPATRFDHAVRRANAYREAGAGCLFIPGVADRDVIARLVAAIRGPVNILAGPATPPVAELARLGVARVSVGGGPMRAIMAHTRRIAQDLLATGTYNSYMQDRMPHTDANKLFVNKK
jgi:2-methylisocitrate lyase-like PEP mutase family enzyme